MTALLRHFLQVRLLMAQARLMDLNSRLLNEPRTVRVTPTFIGGGAGGTSSWGQGGGAGGPGLVA